MSEPDPGPGTSRPPAPPPGGYRADAVVVAAGSSSRMGGIDKLEASVGGRPVLARAIDAFVRAPSVDRIVVVAGPSRLAALRSQPWLPDAVVSVVGGGARRQESVAAGVAALESLEAARGRQEGPAADRVVLVHDGARPFVSVDLIEAVAAAAAEFGAAIPVLPVAETVKRIEAGRVAATLDRSTLGTAQTPQGFRRSVLHAAYAQLDPAGPVAWTDEAALCETCRIPVHALPGEPTNLKVTVPEDLVRAEALHAVRTQVRVGQGTDSHPFGPGIPLALGGIAFPGVPRLRGHSDGDVALHAVADAVLGAAGLGDLGAMFPAGSSTPAGIDSGELLDAVRARVEAAGLRVLGCDLTIVAGRPRLAPALQAMRAAIAARLGVPSEAVNVKASTGNLTGMEGAGRGISAHAVALLETVR